MRYYGTITGLASMEPCLFRHGKRRRQEYHRRDPQASMEPCLFRHGKRIEAALEIRDQERLQWSHVFSDMVSRAPREPVAPAVKRFNGAMSFQTW